MLLLASRQLVGCGLSYSVRDAVWCRRSNSLRVGKSSQVQEVLKDVLRKTHIVLGAMFG